MAKVNGVEFRQQLLDLAVRSACPGDESYKVLQRAQDYAKWVLPPQHMTSVPQPFHLVEIEIGPKDGK